MRVGGVIENQFGDDPQVAPMRLAHEGAELGARSVGGVDVAVVGDVVTIIAPGRGVERQQPHGVDAQILDVLELARETGEISAAVIVAVEECAHMHLDRKSTRLNSSHSQISYAVFCLKQDTTS